MLLAVSSLTFDGFENNDFKNTFLLAPQIGYKKIEFNCWYAETMTPNKMNALKERCERADLVPISLHVSAFGGRSEEELALNTAHKIRAIEAARELGCRRVVASAMRKTEGSLENIIRELKILLPVAKEKKVKLCLENHCDSLLANVTDYEKIFQEIDSEYLGMCLDGGHFEAEGVLIDEVIDMFSDKINHVHLKENLLFGVKSFCRFGQGTTNNIAMIQRLEEIGYSEYMSVELSPEIEENIKFSMEEYKKPWELFSKYDKRRG